MIDNDLPWEETPERGFGNLPDDAYDKGLMDKSEIEAARVDMEWWYISYVDPGDGHFLGACLVEAKNALRAGEVAHLHGCSQDGEALILPFRDFGDKIPAEEYRHAPLDLVTMEKIWGPQVDMATIDVETEQAIYDLAAEELKKK